MNPGHNTPSERVNLYLVGFMGTGKSTIGYRLAKPLSLKFVDADAEIEKKANKTIAKIFATEGEDYFRQLEREFMESGHPSHGCVVACGGGVLGQTGMAEILHSKGVVVCLFASPQTILQRTSHSRNRPLLNVSNPEEKIRSLLAERLPAYLQAGVAIATDNRTIPEIVKNVIRIYRKGAAGLTRKGKA